MQLILTTPELLAHSVLRSTSWRHVIAEFVAAGTGCSATDLKPRMVAQVSLALALALAAYETWLEGETASLPKLLDQAMSTLVDNIGAVPTRWPD